MTQESFRNWLADMKSAGLARSDAECARLLGVTANGLLKMKRNGSTHVTSLACAALLHRILPYS